MKVQMKKHKILKKSIFWGILLIVFAAALILSNVGILTASAFTIFMSLIMLAIFVKCAIDLGFAGMGFAVGHLLHLYRGYIGIPEQLSSWLLILASIIVGVGLDLIFSGLKKKLKAKRIQCEPDHEVEFETSFKDDTVESDARDYQNGTETTHSASAFSSTTDNMSGSKISIENGFGSQTRYVSSQNFERATIENGLGNVTVYFDNVVMANNTAFIDVDNGLGNVNLYFPPTWGLETDVDNGLGHVKVIGAPSTDPNAPKVRLDIDNGLGNVNLFFN